MTHALEEIIAQREQFVRWGTSRLGSSDDAEDVVQRALERAVAGMTSDVIDPLPWFWGILRHALIDHLRDKSRVARRVERFQALEVTSEPPPQTNLCECGVKMIDELPEGQRAVLERVYLEDETLAEATQALEITASAARVRAHRARRELKTKIERCCGITTYAQAATCAC